MILYIVNRKSFILISDTLLKDFKKNIPLKYTTKVFSVPHLKCFVFGIGVFEFTKLYYDSLLNIITDNFEYIIKMSEKICLDLYNRLEMNKNKVFTKVFLACQEKDNIYLVTFSSDNKFTPNIIKDGLGFYPNIEAIYKEISFEVTKDKIDIDNIVNILKKNENLLDCGGEYFLHMFLDNDGYLIRKIGISEEYKNNLKSMIRYCNSPPERRGESVYFDQNIWGELVDDVDNNILERLETLVKSIKSEKINLTYSIVNIQETSRRKIYKKIEKELELIKKLTYCYYIDDEYILKIKDPFDVYREINDMDPVVKELLNKFKDSINELTTKETDSGIKDQIFISKIMNNISPEKIFEYLDLKYKHVLEEYRKEQIEYRTEINIKNFYEKTIAIICTFIDDFFPSIPGFTKTEIIESIKSAMEKKGRELEKIEINHSDFKITNLESILKKFGLSEDMLPGMLNGFLEASNYYPDRAKLKKKKNAVIDTDDLSHSNFCVHFDVFVSNDARLKHRLNAVKTNLKFRTKIMSLNEFLDKIKKYNII